MNIGSLAYNKLEVKTQFDESHKLILKEIVRKLKHSELTILAILGIVGVKILTAKIEVSEIDNGIWSVALIYLASSLIHSVSF
jgi:hypothetical protein